MIAVVLGTDSITAQAHVTRLLDELDPRRANTNELDGQSASIGELQSAVGTAGFFGVRAVVVHNLLARMGRAGGSERERDLTRASPSLNVSLESLFAAVAPENALILVDLSLISLPAAVKRLLPIDSGVYSSAPPRGSRLVAWTIAAAATAGAPLDTATATFLLQRLFPQTWTRQPANPRFDHPPDLGLIQQEVNKLSLAAYPDSITRKHIELMVNTGEDDRIFSFVDAAYAGQLPAALEQLAKILEVGEDPMRVSILLDQQAELAGVIDAAAGLDVSEVGRAIGLANPQRLRGISRCIQFASPGHAHRRILAARYADRLVKRGQLRAPEDGLYFRLFAKSGGNRNQF